MGNLTGPQGEARLFSTTMHDSCLVLDGLMTGIHIHTGFKPFPHAVLVIHTTASFWLLTASATGWHGSSPLAGSITAPTGSAQCSEPQKLCYTEPHTSNHLPHKVWAWIPSQN